jgi:transitional endoplasmic reticulum ATPase
LTVRKIQAATAKSVSFSPTSNNVRVDNEFSGFIRNRLRSYPLVVGDEVSVVVLGNPVVLKAVRVKPLGAVKIEESTKVVILSGVVAPAVTQSISYEEVGGLADQIRRLREIVEIPLKHPEVFSRLGVEPPRGILLSGPPGCGKTLLAKALAHESESSFHVINGPEVMNKYYGESEARLREIFKEAKDKAPSIVFIDEIDAIAPKREEVFGDVEKRVVAQLLALMDGLSERGNVIVMGATNRPDSIDPALRRPGRFDREIEVAVPNSEARQEIIQIHTRGMPLAADVHLHDLASDLHGYTGADIRALCREAAIKALRKYLPEREWEGDKIPPEVIMKMQVTMSDFLEAAKEIVPTALRELYVEAPSFGFDRVGGLGKVKKRLKENVIWPLQNPSGFAKAGIKPPVGCLLYGPPGCGKTLLAKALAHECGVNFISVKGPELLSKWVGESERAVREIFRKAKNAAPAIILFDEIDSMASSRASPDEYFEGHRSLGQLLTELDSLAGREKVFIVGATNRPDLIDSSLVRPGRLDLRLYVDPPTETERVEILRLLVDSMPLAADVFLEELARKTAGYSGADLSAVCREAGIASVRRNPSDPRVTVSDFDEAVSNIPGSITPEVESWYRKLHSQLPSKFVVKSTRDIYA